MIGYVIEENNVQYPRTTENIPLLYLTSYLISCKDNESKVIC